MTSRRPLKLLLVEDEAILAMDLSLTAEECGYTVVAETASLDDVAALRDDADPDLAFVDLQLANRSSGLDVSALIQRRWAGTVIVFVTANARQIPDDFGGAHGVISKPFSRIGLISALRYLEQGVLKPPPILARPASFVASPAIAARWAA